MWFMRGNKHEKVVSRKVERLNTVLGKQQLTESLLENMQLLQELFEGDETMRYRTIPGKDGQPAYGIVFCDGMVNCLVVDDYIITPLEEILQADMKKAAVDAQMTRFIQTSEAVKTECIKEIIENVTYGDTLLFCEGMKQGFLLNTKGFQIRSVTEPENEKILSGPREGFTEVIMVNLSMLHRRIRTNELKLQFRELGTRTRTKICIAYIDSVVANHALEELLRRLDNLSRQELDGILDSNYITELIRDNPLSPFRNIGYTERPDVVVGKLLEGRIAIFVDGTPVVLTVPYLFIENFQSSEDYYLNSYYTSMSRFLRMIGFLLTITVPAFFVSIVAFHVQMLPTPLMINISASLENVPLPVALEAFLMLLVFDLLRETGVRMPTYVGQALSIVGALVIGQAAVEAKLVSASMIIVVGITGITGLLVPKMNAPIIVVRALLLLLSAALGLFGMIAGLVCLLTHLLNLKTMGISQMLPDNELKLQHVKDTLFRLPWTKMTTRPGVLSGNHRRMTEEKEDFDEE